ncbi:MAG: cytochrome P450, partial [Acidimicrobiales bacterium]
NTVQPIGMATVHMTTDDSCPFHVTESQQALAREFEPFRFLADPHPLLARSRRRAPLFHDEKLDHWVVTDYQTIREILTDHETYSSVNALDPISPLDPAVPEALEAGGFGARPFIVNIDGDEHSEHKRIFTSVLHPRRVARFEPEIRSLARGLIGRFPRSGPFDFVDEFSLEFPALVIFTFLGLPAEDVRDVKSWADTRMQLFFGNLAPEQQRAQAGGIVEFWRYIEDHIARQLDDPGDHFVGDMVRLHLSGEEDVTTNDIANYCWSFLFAGHETTTAQTTSMVRDLLQQRQAWEAVVADQTLVGRAVEESLRMNTSVFNWRRRTTRDVEIHGQTVPAGSDLFVVIGSANRDDTEFADPDRFQVEREEVRRHMGFGFGAHYCVGAGLARLQLKVVLEELISTAPDLELVPGGEQRHIDNVSFCGPRTLWLQRRG